MVVGNTSAGGSRKVGLYDDVLVSGTLNVNGTTTLPNLTITGKADLGVYVNQSVGNNANDVACNSGDIAIGGGGICGQGDAFMVETRPIFANSTATSNGPVNVGNSAMVGWHCNCWNHNLGFFAAPNAVYVTCLSHGK